MTRVETIKQPTAQRNAIFFLSVHVKATNPAMKAGTVGSQTQLYQYLVNEKMI